MKSVDDPSFDFRSDLELSSPIDTDRVWFQTRDLDRAKSNRESVAHPAVTTKNYY
jgi:hypothetical protein